MLFSVEDTSTYSVQSAAIKIYMRWQWFSMCCEVFVDLDLVDVIVNLQLLK